MLSYHRGPDTPLLNRTTGQQLEHIAKQWPDRCALVSRHQRQRLSWAELLRAADNVATDDKVQDRPEEQREGEKLTQAAPKVADEEG